jgi:hypothetical protein
MSMRGYLSRGPYWTRVTLTHSFSN